MRLRWSGGVALACVVLVLAGCSQGSDYAPQTAESLQSRVMGLTTSATSRDYAGALSELARLEQEDNAALSARTISGARHDSILATIAKVRADLISLQTAAAQAAATPTPQPQPQPQPKRPKKDGGDGNGNGGGD